MSDQFMLVNGVTLHRFVVEGPEFGQEWACIAYDHGPFCRLCQKVDATLEAMIQNALSGNFELRARPDGQFEGRLTEKGKREAKHLIETVAEHTELWRQLEGLEGDDDAA